MNGDERARTEQKLRYAKLHLDELAAAPSGRGHDFERAHQEAVLAQLLGAYDALLAELNVVLNCGREGDDVSLGKLRESIKARGGSSPTLRRLYEMQQDEKSWLRQLQDLRHASTHRKGIPLSFYFGGSRDGTVSFKHPDSLEELPEAAAVTLSAWLEQMRTLVVEVREAAMSERAG